MGTTSRRWNLSRCFWNPRRPSNLIRCSKASTGDQPDSRNRETICAVGTNAYRLLTSGNGETAKTDGASERSRSSDSSGRCWMNDVFDVANILFTFHFIVFVWSRSDRCGAMKPKSEGLGGGGRVKEERKPRPVVSLTRPPPTYNRPRC